MAMSNAMAAYGHVFTGLAVMRGRAVETQQGKRSF
jgi:hypothetical protein